MALRSVSRLHALLAANIRRQAPEQLARWEPSLLFGVCSTSYQDSHGPLNVCCWAPMPGPASAVAGYAKSASGKRGGSRDGHKAALVLDLAPETAHMDKAVAQLQEDMSRLHCGRAHPGLLEPINVTLSNGDHRILRSVATVSVRTPQMLVVTAHNSADVSSIVKAISSSALKLQARTEKQEILVPLPRPSGEVVAQFIRQVHTQAESARKKVRSVRRSALEELEGQFDSSGEKQIGTQMVQALHDKYIETIASLAKAKEAELKAAGAVGDR